MNSSASSRLSVDLSNGYMIMNWISHGNEPVTLITGLTGPSIKSITDTKVLVCLFKVKTRFTAFNGRKSIKLKRKIC